MSLTSFLHKLFKDTKLSALPGLMKNMSSRQARAIVQGQGRHRKGKAKPRDWREHRKAMRKMASESRRRNRV